MLLLTLDVILSPTICTGVYLLLTRLTTGELVMVAARLCCQSISSAWQRPWLIPMMSLLASVRLTSQIWQRVVSAIDLLLWATVSWSGGLLLVRTLLSRKPRQQFEQWVERLRSLRLADYTRTVGWSPTQRDFAAVGICVSDYCASLRRPLQSKCAVLLRALMLLVVGAFHIRALSTNKDTLPFTQFHPQEYRASTTSHHGESSIDCTSYTGFPVDCSELARVRAFNREVMPQLAKAKYDSVRKTMTAHGLHGHVWHAGHACPDPYKKSKHDEEDHGWNLFAQHALDNYKLGHCLVSCAEAMHVHAHYVRCASERDSCVQRC